MKLDIDQDEELSKVRELLFLDPAKSELHDQYRRTYAEILARQQFFIESAQVAKTIANPTRAEKSDLTLSFDKKCRKCKIALQNGFCRRCNRTNDHCTVCHLPVKGLSWTCVLCGHGGHLKHIRNYFSNDDRSCPTGCGCQCLNQASDYLNCN